MTTSPRRLLLLSIAALIVLIVIAVIPFPAHTQAKDTPLDPQVEAAALMDATQNEILSSDPGDMEIGPVERNTCLHCHLVGEDKGLWTPVSRWSIFGLAGLLLVFGVYRSANVWTTRKPWKPLITRMAEWVDERYELAESLEKFLKKPVHMFATKWWYCLGGITFLLFLIQGLTGILLAFYYKPTPEEAYISIQYIENEVRFGAGIRAVHHWAANGMIVLCVAHMLRVFITGAFKPPRELNWVGGTLLLIITLGFGFTGYLLPWDQRAYWATTVGTEIGGGIPEIGDLAVLFLRAGWNVTALTLSRFFAAHVLVFPVIIVALMGLHFLMVRRQGIAKPL